MILGFSRHVPVGDTAESSGRHADPDQRKQLFISVPQPLVDAITTAIRGEHKSTYAVGGCSRW